MGMVVLCRALIVIAILVFAGFIVYLQVFEDGGANCLIIGGALAAVVIVSEYSITTTKEKDEKWLTTNQNVN